MNFCPVIHSTAKILGIQNLNETIRTGSNLLRARAINLLLQARFLVLRGGGQFDHKPTLWDRNLGQKKVVEILLTEYRVNTHKGLFDAETYAKAIIGEERHPHVDVSQVTGEQLADDHGRLKPDTRIMAVLDNIDEGQVICTLQADKYDKPNIHALRIPLPPPMSGNVANASWKRARCGCARPCFRLIALKEIEKGEPVIVTKTADLHAVPEGKVVLIRFDGSCKDPKGEAPRAGAGVVVYISEDGQTTKEIRRFGVPLPQASSAAMAEAHGSVESFRVALEMAKDDSYFDFDFMIQGDNLSVIDYWRARKRISNPGMYQIVEDHAGKILTGNRTIEWCYIPRRYNKAADEMAGLAANMVGDIDRAFRDTYTVNERHAFEIPPRGTTQWYQEGAREFDYEESIRRIEVALRGEHEDSPITLPEQARADGVKLDQLEPRYLVPVMAYLTARITQAYYSPRHGPTGRYYPVGRTIAFSYALPKIARYALLATTHYELDISLCHIAIVLSRWVRIAGGPFVLGADTAEKLLVWIAQQIRSWDMSMDEAAGLAKKLIRIIVSGTPDAVCSHITKKGGRVTYWFRDFLHAYNRAKPAILTMLRAEGLAGHHDIGMLEERNQMYFACAAAETKIMLTLIKEILIKHRPRSLVWLHDGIYIHNDVPKNSAQGLFFWAALQCGFPELKNSLRPAEDTLFQLIEERKEAMDADREGSEGETDQEEENEPRNDNEQPVPPGDGTTREGQDEDRSKDEATGEQGSTWWALLRQPLARLPRFFS